MLTQESDESSAVPIATYNSGIDAIGRNYSQVCLDISDLGNFDSDSFTLFKKNSARVVRVELDIPVSSQAATRTLFDENRYIVNSKASPKVFETTLATFRHHVGRNPGHCGT